MRLLITYVVFLDGSYNNENSHKYDLSGGNDYYFEWAGIYICNTAGSFLDNVDYYNGLLYSKYVNINQYDDCIEYGQFHIGMRRYDIKYKGRKASKILKHKRFYRYSFLDEN